MTMQRRLTFAFAAMALVSILLLGSGVLALSQFGAKQSAENDLADRLEAFAVSSEQPGSLGDLRRTLEQTRRFYNLSELNIVTVDADGVVTSVRQDRGGPRRDQPDIRVPSLSSDQVEAFVSGQPVFFDQKGSVTGIIRLANQPALANNDIAILASEELPILRRQGTMWYAISAITVLVLSLIVAAILARRLTKPIKDIQLATSELAKGRLDTRVEPSSNDEVGELAASVNQMAADLQRSKALDRQFLMSVSHDLRTPLTAMRGYGEALIDGTVDSPKEAGAVIVNHADRLNRLVTDIIDLARLDANTFQLNLQPTNLAVVSGRTIAGLAEDADRRSIELHLQAPPEIPLVSADADRLGQVVVNLVHNALKYAERQVVVLLEPGADAMHLRVRDDGPGISSADLPHIFDRLYTASNKPKMSENSSGLGLTIVKELVEAMGGTVTAKSAIGEGTEMTVSFPIEEPSSDGRV